MATAAPMISDQHRLPAAVGSPPLRSAFFSQPPTTASPPDTPPPLRTASPPMQASPPPPLTNSDPSPNGTRAVKSETTTTTTTTTLQQQLGDNCSFRVWKLPKHVFAQYLCAFGLELRYADGKSVQLVDLERPPTTPTQSTELVYHLIYEPADSEPAPAEPGSDKDQTGLHRLTLRVGTEAEDGSPGQVPLCYSRFNSRQYYQEPSNKRFKFDGNHAEWSIKLRFAHRAPVRLKATIDELPQLVAYSEAFVIKGRVPTRVMHEMQMNEATSNQQSLWELAPADKQAAIHSVRERAWALAQSPRLVRAAGMRPRGKIQPPPFLDPNDCISPADDDIASFGAVKATQSLPGTTMPAGASPYPLLLPADHQHQHQSSSSSSSPPLLLDEQNKQPSPLHVTVPVIDPRACVSTGEKVSISASVFGGVPPYRFSWSTGTSAPDYLDRFFGLNSHKLEIHRAALVDTGPYRLSVVDSTGRGVSSVEVALIVKDSNPAKQALPIILEPNTIILPVPPYGHRVYINHIPPAMLSKVVSVRLFSYPRDLIFWCSNNGTSFFDAPHMDAGSYPVHLVFSDARQLPLPCGELHYVDDAGTTDSALFSFILSGANFPMSSSSSSSSSSSAYVNGGVGVGGSGACPTSDDATISSFFSFDHAQLAGSTPLSRTALHEHLQPLLLRLLSGKTDPFEAVRRTVFKLGISYENFLVHTVLDRTALHVAAQFGHVKTVEFLLQQTPVGIDQQDVMGNTALHLAASDGHVAVLEQLIRYGADLSLPNSRGETALMIAQRERFFEAAELLFIVLLRECAVNDGLYMQLTGDNKQHDVEDDDDDDDDDDLSEDTFDDLYDEMTDSTHCLVTSLQESSISIPYRNVALCIGINSYADDSLSNLQGAAADATAMSAVLGASGFEQNILLLDGQATRTNILEALANAVRPPWPTQIRLVVFFAGHSVASTSRWAMVPYEGRPLTMNELVASLAQVPVVHALFMVDSCFCVDIYSSTGSSPLGSELAARSGAHPPLLLGGGSAPYSFLHQPVWEVLAASSDNERASETTDGRSYGIFTHYLLRALSGDAFPHHRNWLTCDELHRWVREKIAVETRGRQTPALFSLLPSSSSSSSASPGQQAHFVFTRPHRTNFAQPRTPATFNVACQWDALPLELFHSGQPQLSVCSSQGAFLAFDEGLVFQGRELEIFLSGLTPLGAANADLACVVTVGQRASSFALAYSRSKNVFEANVTLPDDAPIGDERVFLLSIDIQMNGGRQALLQAPWVLPCVVTAATLAQSRAVGKLLWHGLTAGDGQPAWSRVQSYFRQRFMSKWDPSFAEQLRPFLERVFELADDVPVDCELFQRVWAWLDLLSALEPIHEYLLLISATEAEQSLEELRKPAMLIRLADASPSVAVSWCSGEATIGHSAESMHSLAQLRSFLARAPRLPLLTARQLVDPQQLMAVLSSSAGVPADQHGKSRRRSVSSSAVATSPPAGPSATAVSLPAFAPLADASTSPPLPCVSPQSPPTADFAAFSLTAAASSSSSLSPVLSRASDDGKNAASDDDDGEERQRRQYGRRAGAQPAERQSPFPDVGEVVSIGDLSVRLLSQLEPAVRSPSTAWYEGKARLPGSQHEQTFVVKAIRHTSPALPEEVVVHMALNHHGIVSLLAHELNVFGQQQVSYLALNTVGGMRLSAAVRPGRQTVVKWARELALAISYMHSHEPSVCLGYLSPATVQIVNGSCQIFDLSAARFGDFETAGSTSEADDIALFGGVLSALLAEPDDGTPADRLLSSLVGLAKRCQRAELSVNEIVQALDQASMASSLSLYDCVERNLVQSAIELATRNPDSVQSSPERVRDTPLQLAIRLGLEQMTLQLLGVYLRHNRASADVGLLHIAASCGHAAIVAAFLREPCFRLGVNASDPTTGRTALHAAAMHDHLGAVRLLLHSGASAVVTDYSSKTPVHLALEFSASYRVIAALIESCATPVAFATLVRTPSSRLLVTPLHLAIIMGRADVVQLLLEGKQTTSEIRKLMLSARDATGRSLICIAAAAGQKAIFSLLAGHPAVLAQSDDNRRNVVHTCALSGNGEILALALAEPSSKTLLNQVDSNGSTPLHLAARWGHGHIVKALLKQNAVPNVRNRNGETPLDLASRHGHAAVVQQLQQYTAIVVLHAQPIDDEDEEKKNSFNNSLPGASCYEQAPAMLPDTASNHCFSCQKTFTLFRRRHHCRACGLLFCLQCSSTFMPLPQFGHHEPVRVCDRCESNSKQPARPFAAASPGEHSPLNFVV